MNLETIFNWIGENYKWFFSGAGLIILTLIYKGVGSYFKKIRKRIGTVIKSLGLFLEKDGIKNNSAPKKAINVKQGIQISEEQLEDLKEKTNVLFIDDDPKFKVVNILRTAGWENTQCITDLDKIDDKMLTNSQIVFVDVQGVGIELKCKDEGLGLALLIKKRYSAKKVIIYSAVTKGERFHEALRVADDFLEKNAEPYEFLQLVEEYSFEIFSK